MMWYTTIRYMGTYRSVIQMRISDTLCISTALRYSTVVIKVTLDGSRHCHSLTTSSGCALAITALIRGSVLGLVQDSRYLYSDHDAHHIILYLLNVKARYGQYTRVPSHEAVVLVLASFLVPSTC